MKIEKKVISNLNKCYAMSELTWEGEHRFLVAAEKHDPCYVFADIVLTVIPVVVVYSIGQRYIIGGVTAGAVKG